MSDGKRYFPIIEEVVNVPEEELAEDIVKEYVSSFQRAQIFFDGLERAKKYGLDHEFVDAFFDGLAGRDPMDIEDIKSAVWIGLYEWDI